MQWLVDVHKILSNMIAIYALVMGIWGLFNFFRKQAPDGSYNAALAIAVGLFVLEGVVGVFLVLFGYQPARGLHFLYGVTIVITIPAIFAFTARQQHRPRVVVLWHCDAVHLGSCRAARWTLL